MVDVTRKDRTDRRAVAAGSVKVRPDVLEMIVSGGMSKGDVFQVARVAGIMAAKKTPDLIPLCHPVAVTKIGVEFEADPGQGLIRITAEACAADRTGVEMEAITAATVAGLTIYDMCKAVQKDIEIGPFYLVEKEGGRSGRYSREK